MNNDDRFYSTMAMANDNLNTKQSICPSLDKYAPLIDTIRGYFVQSLEKRICDGLDVFLHDDDDKFPTEFIPYVTKCMDIAGNAVKYFFKDGLIPCIVNTFILNNRLNKVSDNLDTLGMEKNFLRYINITNYIYSNEYWTTYNNKVNGNNDIDNDNESILLRSSNSTNNRVNFDDEIAKRKNSRRPTNNRTTNFTADTLKQLDNFASLMHANSHVDPINSNNNFPIRNLQMVVRDWNKRKIYHRIELPCNYQRIIHHIAEIIGTSWKNSTTDELSEEFIAAINNICNVINKKLEQFDNTTIQRCRLYCNIQKDCIYINLKMMNDDDSKTFLFTKQISRSNDLLKKLNPSENDKSGPTIKSKPIHERISFEVKNKRNNSTSTRSSFRTINENPHEETTRKIIATGSSLPPNDGDDDDDDDDDDYSNNYCPYESHDIEEECGRTVDCLCSMHNFHGNWEHCDSKCSCDLSHDETFHTARNGLEDNTRQIPSETTILDESFRNLSASTPVNNNLQKIPMTKMIDYDKSVETLHDGVQLMQTNDSVYSEGTMLTQSRISDALKEIVALSLKGVSRGSSQFKSTPIQTSETEKIEEANEIAEITQIEAIEEVVKIEELETINNVNIQRKIIQIHSEVIEFINELVIELIRELDLILKVPTPPSLDSKLKLSLIDESREIETKASPSSSSSGSIKKISKNKSLITPLVTKDHCESCITVTSPCKYSRKSSLTSLVIKYSKERSANLPNVCPRVESVSDIEAHYGISNLYTTGDSSMNNLYSVCTHKWQSEICHCKKYKKSKARSRIYISKEKLNRYLPKLCKYPRRIIAAIRKRFRNIFSKKTLRILQYLIRKKFVKLVFARENARNASKICSCKLQHRTFIKNNYPCNCLRMKQSNNNLSSYKNNDWSDSDKSKYQSVSSLSQNVYMPKQEKYLTNYNDTCAKRESELINWYQRRRLPNLITDIEHRDINSKLLNNEKYLCQCPCCCDSIEAINEYQSTNNSILNVNNREQRIPSNYKRMKPRSSYKYFDDKKSKNTSPSPPPSSLSSKDNHFCCYHKIFAARTFNERSFNHPRYINHRSISDVYDVDCGECFGPTDYNFRLMLNQYVKLCKNIKSLQKNREQSATSKASWTTSQNDKFK